MSDRSIGRIYASQWTVTCGRCRNSEVLAERRDAKRFGWLPSAVFGYVCPDCIADNREVFAQQQPEPGKVPETDTISDTAGPKS